MARSHAPNRQLTSKSPGFSPQSPRIRRYKEFWAHPLAESPKWALQYQKVMTDPFLVSQDGRRTWHLPVMNAFEAKRYGILSSGSKSSRDCFWAKRISWPIGRQLTQSEASDISNFSILVQGPLESSTESGIWVITTRISPARTEAKRELAANPPHIGMINRLWHNKIQAAWKIDRSRSAPVPILPGSAWVGEKDFLFLSPNPCFWAETWQINKHLRGISKKLGLEDMRLAVAIGQGDRLKLDLLPHGSRQRW